MTIIAAALAPLTLGEPVAHRNLAMFPLLGGKEGPPPYLTLREALDAGLAAVTEVSEGGSVPRLALRNRGDLPVLVVDGEELVGAKQNRILNITILAPGRATTVIPVSCVEQGRWSYRARDFGDGGRMLFHKARAEKAARVSESRQRGGGNDANQGEVWRQIACKMESMRVDSPSMAMQDIYDRNAAGVEEYVDAIRPAPGQAGAVFAVNGRVEGIELFAYPGTLSRILVKLVRGYALDALEELRGPVPAPPRARVAAFLGKAAKARVDSFPASGLGEDLRFRSPGVAGGALAVDGAVLHLCAFRQGRESARPAGDDGGTIRRRRDGQSSLFE